LALVLSNPYRAFAPPTPIAGLALRGGAGVRQELEAVGLSSSLSRERVKALSGAQRVRLAVALALTGTLEVLMVDDVFDHLAPEVWGELQSDIDRALGKGALVLASRHEEALRGMKQLLVLRRGVAVEWGGQQEIRAAPAHPYTQALLEGTPPPDVEGETQPVVRLGESHWARVPRS
jgi:ABC-type proline/glycine betaine transport system ATPase subunit